MKIIKRINKTSLVLSVLCSCLLCACNDNSEPTAFREEPAIIPGDTIFVAADSSQRFILGSLIQVYEALNPHRKVIPLFDREKKLYSSYLQNDRVDILFRSYELNDKEKKAIEIRRLNPKIHPLWSDGLALVASPQFSRDSIAEEELLAVLSGRSNAFSVVLDNSHTAAYDLIHERFKLDQANINAYASGSEEAVMETVAGRNNYLGLVGSVYFSGYKAKKDAIKKNIKLLGLMPQGKTKAEYPFQDQLFNGVYPLSRQIYLINVGALDGSGSAFASFIMSERGQRIILKSGLLPAKLPSRVVEIN